MLSLNVLRPFPADLFRQELAGVKAIVVGDRADSYGADGGNLSLEVRAAIQVDPDNRTRVLTRIYGLGGKDFDDSDAEIFSGRRWKRRKPAAWKNISPTTEPMPVTRTKCGPWAAGH